MGALSEELIGNTPELHMKVGVSIEIELPLVWIKGAGNLCLFPKKPVSLVYTDLNNKPV